MIGICISLMIIFFIVAVGVAIFYKEPLLFVLIFVSGILVTVIVVLFLHMFI